MSRRAVLFRDPNTVDALRFLLFLPAYWIAYRFGSLFSQTAAAPLWFPDSVLLCWLLSTPSKQWWVYLVVPLPIRLLAMPLSTLPLWFLLATFANDSLKGLFSGYVLRRVLGSPVRLSTMRALAIFIATAATAAPILSGLGGAAARYGLGYSFWRSWYQWFLGNSLAGVLITPTLLYWFVDGHSAKRRLKELALLGSGLAVVSYYAFLVPHTVYSPLLLYVPLPFLIWAVVRTGPIGTSSALSLLSIVSIFGSALGKGVFSIGSPSQNVLSLQLFLLLVSVPLLFLAVLVEEWQTIQENLRRSQETVDKQYERIRNLAGRLINAQEEEKRRIARELHDDIGQRVTLFQIRLTELCEDLPGGMRSERALIKELVDGTAELATDIHDLSHELHSATLQLLGLGAILRKLCGQASKQYGIIVHLEAAEIPALSPDVELCLYRVAQEAINNAVRHGRADKITIELHSDNGLVRMSVKDSGIGFDPGAVSNGLGLVSMQERLRMLGGEVVIESQPQAGTEVIVQLPALWKAESSELAR
jgi:signal transduction histidine kinase